MDTVDNINNDTSYSKNPDIAISVYNVIENIDSKSLLKNKKLCNKKKNGL